MSDVHETHNHPTDDEDRLQQQLALMTLELKDHMDQALNTALMNISREVAYETVESIEQHFVDTMTAFDQEIQRIRETLKVIELKKPPTSVNTSLTSLLGSLAIGLVCSLISAVMAVHLYIGWVLPDHRVYYDYGRLWKTTFDPLPDTDKKAILKLLKGKQNLKNS